MLALTTLRRLLTPAAVRYQCATFTSASCRSASAAPSSSPVGTRRQKIAAAPAAPTEHEATMSAGASHAGASSGGDTAGGWHQGAPISCLNSSASLGIDTDLMSPEYGWSLEQLMELAGLAVAQATAHVIPRARPSDGRTTRVLVVCGPGNNGGDGLVAARHLGLFGFDCTVVYPKEPKQDLYKRLLQSLRSFDIPVLDSLPSDLSSYHVILDAIFGFSFDPKDGIREPFATIIQQLISIQSSIPIVSIDVPSGWSVNNTVASSSSSAEALAKLMQPEYLISLTAPKECARQFKGSRHLLGGRFVPRSLIVKYGLVLPPYPDSAQWQDITGIPLAQPQPQPPSS